jgi:predicted metalloprotease
MQRQGRTKVRQPALRMIGVMVLLASSLMLCATACSGGTRSTPAAQNTNTKDLQNPAKAGEKVLADLPEVNPPLTVSNPRIVGSQNMTTAQLVRSIGANINTKWLAVFQKAGYAYTKAKFVVYNQPISADGCLRIAVPRLGPFYCPQNMTVYYPLSWMVRSGQTPRQIGDFAVAVILAHETGHHVQNLLGILGNPKLYTIQRELQADCVAGVWSRSVYKEGLLQRGDIEEGIRVMDDAADLPGTPQESPRAHGTAAQRTKSFFTGYKSGQASQCKP